ncbi:MAG: S66 peptidase family protein [Patescibacteria group bacterium]|nr:S66 peptidase family protein [Patescibacteria group bacterium]
MTIKKILPSRLKKGSSIGVIAPADPVKNIHPDDVVQRAYDYLSDKGFNIIEGKSTQESTKKHTAGTIDLRVNDIHEFIKNDEVDCIMAYWGGFNSNQLLDQLDYELIKNNPKIIIGYSDITALITAITTKTGLVTFSGPGVISFAKPEPFNYTWEYFKKMCIDPQDQLLYEASPDYADDLYFLREDDNHRIKQKNEGLKIFKEGKAEGEIVAGNLQTLLILVGTKYLPDMTGKILFIEEDETSTPAHFDRFLMQCRQIGWFHKIKGLVIGRFTEHSKFDKEDSLEDLLKMYFNDAKFPVLYNMDFGHSDPMITIPHGGGVKIDSGKKEIIFEQAVK